MKYLKYTQYAYLIFVPFLIYSGVSKYITDGIEAAWLYFFLAIAALVMFFVRRSFVNKFEDKNKQ